MLRKAVPTDIVDLKDEVDGAWADGKAPLKLIAEVGQRKWKYTS